MDSVEQFVNNQFYVDDALGSTTTSSEAISILGGAVKRLQYSGINLCKIRSNDEEILQAFPNSERLQAVVNFGPLDTLHDSPSSTDLGQVTSSLGL